MPGGYPWSQGDLLLANDLNAAINAASSAVAAGGPFLPLSGGTISPAFLRLDGAAGSMRPLWYSTALSPRWMLGATPDAEAGGNVGSNLGLYAYNDTGGYIGTALSISRASGPAGMSAPYIYNMAPWRQLGASGSFPNGITGNWQEIGPQDRSPAMPLPANCLAVTAGSPVVTITWPGAAAGNGGWVGANDFGSQTWINLQGAAAVGGITPSGWLLVQSVINQNAFTVNWTANATATTTGGGAAVTAQPSHVTTLNRTSSQVTSAGWGFPVQTAELWEIIPNYAQPSGAGGTPRYEQRWHWTVGPSDPAGTSSFAIVGIEWDLTNRGVDAGYNPELSSVQQLSCAFYAGPTMVPPFATGGGTATNWNTVYTVFSGQNDNLVLGVYDAFSTQPNSLVGQKFDPTGHGGVAADFFGSRTRSPYLNPLSVTSGSSTVTVRIFPSDITGMAAGDQVYFPGGVTIQGVTLATGTYTIGSVNAGAGTFTVTGTGSATANGSGGGLYFPMSFLPLAPYSPLQTYGLWQHGIISDAGARFLSGAIIETQPGNAIAWTSGAAIASINGVAGTAGNIGVTITTAGTGAVNIAGHAATTATTPASFSANRYLPIQVNGTTYYLPMATIAW